MIIYSYCKNILMMKSGKFTIASRSNCNVEDNVLICCESVVIGSCACHCTPYCIKYQVVVVNSYWRTSTGHGSRCQCVVKSWTWSGTRRYLQNDIWNWAWASVVKTVEFYVKNMIIISATEAQILTSSESNLHECICNFLK